MTALLEHGGNLRQAALRYGIPLAEWLDVSTGINPTQYPADDIPPVLWQRLPEADDGLAEAAAAYYGIPQGTLLATAGSQAALQALPRLRAPCRVGIVGPMYAEHIRAWSATGHTVSYLDQLGTTSEQDAQQLDGLAVLVVCNPNNPTGSLRSPATLLGWHRQLADRGGWLIVDEAFMDATPEQSMFNQIDAASWPPGLIVLRSLGKFFGLAGARVGFTAAEPPLLAALEALLGPWPLAAPARWLAQKALWDSGWQKRQRAHLHQQAQQLSALLTAHHLAPDGGTALFQYVKTGQARTLQARLAQQGIWVRAFDTPAALRFGLPPSEAWGRLGQAFSKAT